MSEARKYSIFSAKGESLKNSATADAIIALDRKNMEATLKAVDREFPEEKRRTTLFHPSNQMVIAMMDEEVAGYIDYCNDLTDPQDLYLSSIQIKAEHRGGVLFKLLLSNALAASRAQNFRRIKTHIQKSNALMLAIAKKLGFTLQENPSNAGTLDVFAERSLLESSRLKRLFGVK